MARYAYVDGRYVAHDAAAVHVEDRGFQFADGVYEVVSIIGGRMIDMEGHLDRLAPVGWGEGHHDSGYPLGALRHKGDITAGELHGQDPGFGRGRV